MTDLEQKISNAIKSFVADLKTTELDAQNKMKEADRRLEANLEYQTQLTEREKAIEAKLAEEKKKIANELRRQEDISRNVSAELQRQYNNNKKLETKLAGMKEDVEASKSNRQKSEDELAKKKELNEALRIKIQEQEGLYRSLEDRIKAEDLRKKQNDLQEKELTDFSEMLVIKEAELSNRELALKKNEKKIAQELLRLKLKE